MYAGTENGKFLVLDLRALDKPPKTITVSENGDQIIAISVQVRHPCNNNPSVLF